MATERKETREEEVARVRSYLASQAVKRTPAQLVETLREAHNQFLAALATVPDALFYSIPREGEWSVADVLLHVCTIAEQEKVTLSATMKRGETAPEIRDALVPAPREATRADLLAKLNASREQLIAHVLQADPQAHLDVTWSHPEFGAMNWREWLLFARVHTLDHARQIEGIMTTFAQQGGAGR
jgi:uncharacterized damage-inducible protein DinB